MRLRQPSSDTPTSSPLALPALRSVTLAAAAAAAMVISLFSAPSASGAEAPLPPPNGLTAQSAAASCWEIKQVTPAAPSGIYWLVTPQLGAPERFYCDQSTSGGGWVLIGRGREDWSVSNEGFGTPAEVRDVITGQEAFAPRQLSSQVVDALLNGTAVRSLDDGVRLRRATNTTGTTWQEVTFKFNSPRNDWSWMFDNEQRVGSWRFGNTTGSGGTTNSFGTGTAQNRVQTFAGSNQGWVYGFGYGTSSRGNPAASSYIWAPTTSSPNPRPFTQVFLRPKLMSSSTFSVIPASGTPEKEGIAVHESFAQRTTWGVAGLGAGPSSLEGSNEVSAFAEGNGVVYVGGNFTTVQQSSGGAGQVSQSYLAAFDVDTGAWISSFRPTFNNQVKALTVLPDGRVAAGGYFTTVNGQPREGIVVLNPATGATDSQFTGRLINRLSGGVPIVRALDVQDGWLYAAGTFTHSTGGTGPERYTRAAARFSVTNGTPDAWNPEFNGTVIALDASDRGDRAYFSGYFTQSAGRTAMKVAALSTASTQLYPWTVDFSNASSNYQQTIKEAGDRVWIGGSQHMFFSYDRTTLAELSTNITKAGGDLQAAATNGVAVYGGCHCFHTVYVGADKWSGVGTSWTQASRINSVGAWNAATGAHLTEFSPILNTRNGGGTWALFVDSRGVLWNGGDFTGSVREGFTKQWSGGYIRYGVADHVAPTSPAALGVSETSTGVRLAWSGSTDDRGPVTYQVLRRDRVVATTTGLSVDLPLAPNGTNYFVRAADAAGNWSASTPAAQVGNTPVPPDPSTATFIPAGSGWNYWYNQSAPASGWTGNGYDDSAWATGAAPLGYGQATLGTTLPSLDPKPITSYYRKAISIPNAGALANVRLTTRADDGIVVYVNGYEVLRQNLDAGTLTHNYYASSAPNASSALANPVSVVVPGSAFVSGVNVVTAEVHSGYRTTPSHSFELTAVGTTDAATIPPPGPADPPEEPPVDPPDDPEDPGDPPDEPAAALVAAGSGWNYWYSADAPAAEWTGVDFDDSTWTGGAAPLGYGQATLGTTLPTLDPRPITSYYRHAFPVADVGQLSTVTITTRADDGIIVYVNGVEVVRHNLDPGAITHNYYAGASPNASSALANPVTVQVPASAFRTGTNVISAEVHSGYRTTPSHSFELTATTG